MPSFSEQELEDLQGFLKDWLRHSGRTQADLRRALRAGSIRMPVLLEVLQSTYSRQGLVGLAQQLCAVEERWQEEEGGGPGLLNDAAESADLGQLDLLLEEIRADRRL